MGKLREFIISVSDIGSLTADDNLFLSPWSGIIARSGAAVTSTPADVSRAEVLSPLLPTREYQFIVLDSICAKKGNKNEPMSYLALRK
jgi:hypothetical protein